MHRVHSGHSVMCSVGRLVTFLARITSDTQIGIGTALFGVLSNWRRIDVARVRTPAAMKSVNTKWDLLQVADCFVCMC